MSTSKEILPEPSLIIDEERVVQAVSAINERRYNTLPRSRKKIMGKILSNRALPVLLSTVLFLTIVGCGNASTNVQSPENDDNIPALQAPTSETTYYEYGDTKVIVDEKGIPFKYLKKDGTEVRLDRQFIEKIQQEAVNSQEPQFATLIKIEKPPIPQPKPSIEHPVLINLPKDLVSERELEKRGISIIQPDNTQLFIREGAFGKGAPLEQFNATDRKLKIVILNGPVISKAYMSDPKYAPFRYLLDERNKQIAEYKTEQIQSYRDEIDYWKAELKKARSIGASTQIASAERTLLNFKRILYEYQNVFTNEEFISLMVGNSSDAAGLYFGTRNIGNELSTVIFVAAGEKKTPDDRILFSFDSKGQPLVYFSSFGHTPGLEPKATQTHPNPKDFLINPSATPSNPKSYPYEGQTAGLVLLHELMHDKLIEHRILQNIRPNYSEYDTDMGAMEWIKKGWEKWEKSGYKDDNGFYFIFQLPDGKGYILVQQPLVANTDEEIHT